MSEACPDVPLYLPGVCDPEVDYYDAIQAFARERFRLLASAVVSDLIEMDPSGVFEQLSKPLQNVWDEWCWYQSNYDNDCGSLSAAFETTLEAVIAGHVLSVPDTEAVLLSCAICEDQEDMPSRSDIDLCDFLREIVTDFAGHRSMAEFEVDALVESHDGENGEEDGVSSDFNQPESENV